MSDAYTCDPFKYKKIGISIVNALIIRFFFKNWSYL